MAEISHIEWTDATWNPVRGCTKISPGCTHCYAETFAERFRGVPGHPYEKGFDLRLVPERLLDPFRWPKAKMVFVNSMSDLFHNDVPTSYIAAVAEIMCEGSWHTYQVLTKRADRLRDLLSAELKFAAGKSHVWWGVSVEDRKYGLPRIECLRSAPAQVRFLSIEPLLEDLGELNLAGIHWVIVGGESGWGARPMSQEWVLSIMRQCQLANVPFFFKQWGGVHKAKAGRKLLGRVHDGFPPLVRSELPDKRGRQEALAACSKRIASALGSHLVSSELPLFRKETSQVS
jgi:protein gp37